MPTIFESNIFALTGGHTAGRVRARPLCPPYALSHRQISFRPRSPDSECVVPYIYRDGIPVPELGGHVMRLSSSLVAPSAVAILSTALLCGPSGPAISQTELPKITVVAPKPLARPQRPVATPQRPARVANTVASRPASPPTQAPSATAQKPAPAKDSVMAKFAAIERTSSSCADGCATSFRYGNQPWNGCSTTGAEFGFSPTCRNVGNYKTYFECRDARMFLGARQNEAWWYCSSLHAGGKLAGEKKVEVAELKRSGHR